MPYHEDQSSLYYPFESLDLFINFVQGWGYPDHQVYKISFVEHLQKNREVLASIKIDRFCGAKN